MIKILILLSISNYVFASDSLYVKDLLFKDFRTKQFVYQNKTKIKIGDKIDENDVYRDVKRLYEESIFSDIRVLGVIENDSIELIYYPKSITEYSFIPQLHILNYADTSFVGVSISGDVKIKNIFGNNEIYEMYYENSLPIGYSDKGINIVDHYRLRNLTLKLYNESLTPINVILGMQYNYSSQDAMKVKDDDVEINSFDGNIGKRFNRYNVVNFYSGIRFYKYSDKFEHMNYNYPYASLNYFWNNYDYLYYPSKKNYFSVEVTKYGAEQFIENYYLNRDKVLFIRSFFGFKFFIKNEFTTLFNINKITDNMLLHSGGMLSNKGYYHNALPYFYKVSIDSSMQKIGAQTSNLLSIELRHKLFKIGPLQNFFLNYMSSIFEIGLFFDDTYMLSKELKRKEHYYSYGLGFFVWPIKFHEYAGVYFSNNRYNERLFTIVSTFNF